MSYSKEQSSLNCPRDSYYPKCEECGPKSKNVCPLYSGEVSSRDKFASLLFSPGKLPIWGPRAIFNSSTTLDYIPEDIDLTNLKGSLSGTIKPFRPEMVTGKGK